MTIVDIEAAVKLLLDETIVAVPTETVYGLAGDATSVIACEKIYATKRRPKHNPLIIHVASLEDAKHFGIFNDDAEKIAKLCWPGPLTMVVPKVNPLEISLTHSTDFIRSHSTDDEKYNKYTICDVATAGLQTIAIRVPSNPIIRDIIIKSGKPLAIPSANLSTRISPTTVEHVQKSFCDTVPIVDGGKTIYGIESTIIDFSIGEPTLLRFGFITLETINEILEKNIKVLSTIDTRCIKAPGLLKKHYSPTCPIRINVSDFHPDEVVVNYGPNNIYLTNKYIFNLSVTGDLIEAATSLYDLLQMAEDIVHSEGMVGIAVSPIPQLGIGLAINDKLERAASTDK